MPEAFANMFVCRCTKDQSSVRQLGRLSVYKLLRSCTNSQGLMTGVSRFELKHVVLDKGLRA